MAVSSILLQQEAPGGAVCSSMETMPLEGETAPHGGMFVCLCLASQKPSEREFFVPARTHLGVKLLSINAGMIWLGH